MNTRKFKFIINPNILLLLISIWLESCSFSNKLSAPINSVIYSNDSNTNNTSKNVMTSLSKKNNNFIRKTSSVAQPKINLSHYSSLQNIANFRRVQIENGHIIYSRDYENICKGEYLANTYTVKHGDTIFYIAWITSNDFRDLAQRNKIPAPYNIRVGQKLQVKRKLSKLVIPNDIIPNKDHTRLKVKFSENLNNKNLSLNNNANMPIRAPVITHKTSYTRLTKNSTPLDSLTYMWHWPTKGKVVYDNSYSEEGNKGINIAGSKGQAIFATADGRVVYAGNALRGYGNLIIIKHNDEYLSAYAHNDKMLVREQQEVKAWQKIATMGSTGTNSTRLHFEIRYKGKSVNPLQFLPRR